LLAGDHVARVGQQHQQNLEGLAGQADTIAVLAQFARRAIHFKRPECQAKGLGLGRHRVTNARTQSTMRCSGCRGGQITALALTAWLIVNPTFKMTARAWIEGGSSIYG
jgi:hypothetical protein